MASSSKRQTTMAKIQREQAVREKRARKAEKKEARLASAGAAVPEAPLVLLDAPTHIETAEPETPAVTTSAAPESAPAA